MKTQMTHEQKGKPVLSNLTVGNWITFLAGCLFIVSLFLDWATNVFIVYKGIFFMEPIISRVSGLPFLYFVTLLAAGGCMLLCLPFLKGRNRANYKFIPIIQIILSVLGLLPFILLQYEVRSWNGRIEAGVGVAMLAAFGLLIGSILTLIEIRQQQIKGIV